MEIPAGEYVSGTPLAAEAKLRRASGDGRLRWRATRAVFREDLPTARGGVPCLRALRIPVATVVNMVAGGMSAQQIVGELPPLEIEDVSAALRSAADAVADCEIPVQPTLR